MKYRLTRGYAFGALTEALACIEVAVEARKVARVDFEPDAMAGQEDVADCPQIYRKQVRLAGLHHSWSAGRLSIARADAPVEQILRVAVRMYIDQLGGEVGIHSRRRRPEGDRHGSGNFKRLIQRIGGIDQYIAPLFYRSLILHTHIDCQIVAAQ